MVQSGYTEALDRKSEGLIVCLGKILKPRVDGSDNEFLVEHYVAAGLEELVVSGSFWPKALVQEEIRKLTEGFPAIQEKIVELSNHLRILEHAGRDLSGAEQLLELSSLACTLLSKVRCDLKFFMGPPSSTDELTGLNERDKSDIPSNELERHFNFSLTETPLLCTKVIGDLRSVVSVNQRDLESFKLPNRDPQGEPWYDCVEKRSDERTKNAMNTIEALTALQGALERHRSPRYSKVS